MPEQANVDWVKVQNQRSEGKPVSQLAKEFGVSVPTIYNHTKEPSNGKKKGSRIATVARLPKPPKIHTRAEHGRYTALPEAIAELEAKRDEIDKAIAVLRTLAD